MRVITYLSIILLFSCSTNDSSENLLDEKQILLVGKWNGYKTNTTDLNLPIHIIFSYDQGFEIKENGLIIGRVRTNPSHERPEIKNYDQYVAKWSITKDNTVEFKSDEHGMLLYNHFIIIELTKDHLVVETENGNRTYLSKVTD